MSSRVEIVVVYNDQRTLETAFLQSAGLEHAAVTLINNTMTRRSLPAIFNEHKASCRVEWLVFCHQDFVVYDVDWIGRITTLSQDACYGPIGIDEFGRLQGQIQQTDGSLLGSRMDGAEVAGLDEQCLIAPRRVYSAVEFDERFPFDFYVHDFCLSAKRKGFGVRTFQLECQHRSKSLTGDVTRVAYRDAKKAYIAKHGGLGPLSTTSFQWRPKYWSTPEQNEAFQAELDLIPSGSRVLEVGTAAGHVTRALRRKGCTVTGIELDQELARMAEPMCRRMVLGNIEELDLDRSIPEKFDVILCGDVLEHLRDPGPVLQKLTRRLAPNGYFVGSLPNVAHASVRVGLLRGKFTYVKEGLLDSTHLRFFTLESIVDLFNRNGLQICNLQRVKKGLFDTEIPVSPAGLQIAIARCVADDAEATTYQYVVRAIPSTASNTLEELRDPAFEPKIARRILSRYCMEKAWAAFRQRPVDRLEVRAWARLAFGLAPSIRSGVYWGTSFVPWVKRLPPSPVRWFRR